MDALMGESAHQHPGKSLVPTLTPAGLENLRWSKGSGDGQPSRLGCGFGLGRELPQNGDVEHADSATDKPSHGEQHIRLGRIGVAKCLHAPLVDHQSKRCLLITDSGFNTHDMAERFLAFLEELK